MLFYFKSKPDGLLVYQTAQFTMENIEKVTYEEYRCTENFPEFEIPMDPTEMMLIGKTLLLFAKKNIHR